MPDFEYDADALIGRKHRPEPERPAAQPCKRRCLKCSEKFTSPGPHVRLCDRCRLANDNVHDPHTGTADRRPHPPGKRRRTGPRDLNTAILSTPNV